MVSKRSKTAAAAKQRSRPALAVALPHDLVVDIVALVAATSARPIADLTSIRATSKAMYAASKERHVGRRVALEKEEAYAMKWRENARYLAVVEGLAAAGNPEACFLAGVALVFGSKQQQKPAAGGLVLLEQAAVAGHKAAAYVLGILLHTADGMRDVAERYIGQVEGCKSEGETKRTNRECKRWRRLVVDVVRELTWKKMAGPPGRVPVMALEDGSNRCTSKGCGVPPDGWAEYDVFCSDGCRIRHEYTQFFTEVFNYLP